MLIKFHGRYNALIVTQQSYWKKSKICDQDAATVLKLYLDA